DLIQPITLRHAERRGKLAQAIVVSQALMRQPVHSLASLVTQRATRRGEGVVVGDDHPALAGGDLLIGIEPEDTGAPKPADRSRPGKSAEALAGIFDQDQLILL